MRRALFQIVLAGWLSVSVVVAHAAWTPVEIGPEQQNYLILAGGTVSLQGAAAKAKQSHGGKVVKAETKSRGGKQIHHIRLVKDGRVKTILIDAATGKELSR